MILSSGLHLPLESISKLWGVESESGSCSAVSDSLQPHGLYSPWNSLGQNTGVGSLSLLQAIFPTQGLNPDLLCCRQILYQLSHQGSPRILEWVAYPFTRGSSKPRNQTRVSCIAGRFFTNWAISEAQQNEKSGTNRYFWKYICNIHDKNVNDSNLKKNFITQWKYFGRKDRGKKIEKGPINMKKFNFSSNQKYKNGNIFPSPKLAKE